MSDWSKRELKLKPDHLWITKPGYQVFVANRGDVRFDIPDSWVVVADASSIKFHDRQPPDDNCTLQLSVLKLPPYDWSTVPLSPLLTDVTKRDGREVLFRGEVYTVNRAEQELAWTEVRFRDPREDREALSRVCLARKADIQVLLTFDYWSVDSTKLDAAWNELVASLRLATTFEDPSLGDVGRG